MIIPRDNTCCCFYASLSNDYSLSDNELIDKSEYPVVT